MSLSKIIYMEVVGPISGDGRHVVADSCSRWYAAAGAGTILRFRRDDCRYDHGPIPATAINLSPVTICVIGGNYLLFDASETGRSGV